MNVKHMGLAREGFTLAADIMKCYQNCVYIIPINAISKLFAGEGNSHVSRESPVCNGQSQSTYLSSSKYLW